MRLKYVIGGALVALATLAAPGPANAILLIEPGNVTDESGFALIPTGFTAAQMALYAGIVGLSEGGSGVATPAAPPILGATNVFNAPCNVAPFLNCGDTVAGNAAGTRLDWTSGANDNLPGPETEDFVCGAVGPAGSYCAAGIGTVIPTHNPVTLLGLSIFSGASETTPAPEPASLALLASALIGLGVMRRRRKA